MPFKIKPPVERKPTTKLDLRNKLANWDEYSNRQLMMVAVELFDRIEQLEAQITVLDRSTDPNIP